HECFGTCTHLYLDYTVDFKPRCQTREDHPQLAPLLESNRNRMEQTYAKMAVYEDTLRHIQQQHFMLSIVLHNGLLPVTDGLSLMWAAGRTKNKFIEVGSGNSTLYIKAGMSHHKNSAKLISIDPHPRAEIDKICDEVIRQPIEN